MIYENFDIAITKFPKMQSGSSSQIAVPNMWLLVQTAMEIKMEMWAQSNCWGKCDFNKPKQVISYGKENTSLKTIRCEVS